LADGSLAEAAFRHYLVQDYLFLTEFARAYALSVYIRKNLIFLKGKTQLLGTVSEQ
jgi:thiaminase/transcriptional activator TenA